MYRPSLRYWTPAEIALHTGAVDFVLELVAFLKRECSSICSSALSDIAQLEYGMYKQFKRTLPSLCELAGDECADHVQASPATSSSPAHFNTVLWIEDPSVAETIGVKGEPSGRIEFALLR